MPLINVQPRDMQDGTRITYFNDSVGPTSTTYTFNVNQEMIVLRNKGSKNLSYTIGATSGVLGQGELIKVNGNFSSFTLSSSQGTQAFEIISDEIGTISGSSDYTSLASQVAERIKTINGIAPDASGNITISTGSGSGSGGSTLVYSDLSALQAAYPSGTTQPAWVTSENAWYYWNGFISAPDTTPPNNVTGVNATNVTQTSMTIGWTAISDAVSYEVWKNGSLLTSVSNSPYNASDLTANTSYSWVIKAKDSSGNVASGSTPLVQSTLAVDVTPPADTTPPILTITPATTFTDTQTVTMSANETATIYYTLDDTDPKTSGTKLTYSSPLTLTATDTIKAYAKDSANNESGVQTVTYTKEVQSDVLVSDDFNRSDASTLGTTPVGSKAWNGGLQIIGNQAGVATALTGSTGTTSAYEFIDAGVSDNIELSMDLVVSGAFSSTIVGLMFRFSDSGHHYAFGCKGTDQTIGVWAVGATGTSAIANKSLNMIGTHTLKVTLSGQVVNCYVDGVLQITFNDVSPLQTNTKHGILLYSTNVPKVDNFVIKQL